MGDGSKGELERPREWLSSEVEVRHPRKWLVLGAFVAVALLLVALD